MNLRIFVLVACVLIAPTLVPRSAAAAYKEIVLYNFCVKGVGSCSHTDGLSGGLIRDASGKLYSTGYGGGFDRETLFELVPPAAGGTRWTLKELYSFCPHGEDFCAGPGGLIRGASGTLYGTTSDSCDPLDPLSFCDTVFELTPPATGKTAWTETVLHTFHGYQNLGDPGLSGGVFRGASGTLYGTTSPFPPFDGGTVFELVPPAAGKTGWTYKVLYRFCTRGGLNCTDGDQPDGGVIQDASGKLYGTTFEGGAYGAGTVFELMPPAAGEIAWKHNVLYSFCRLGCIDGDGPDAGLIRDAAGRLYGTTRHGGVPDLGTVFELVPPAAGKTAWTEIVLHTFCAKALCADGEVPNTTGMIRDPAGRLYGTTQGGANGAGTVFELAPPALGKTGWTYQVLYSFCARGGRACTDGSFPGTVIRDASGNLYGTAGGGRFGGGIVFELSP